MAVVADPVSSDLGPFSVPWRTTICPCLIRSVQWLLPAHPKTVEKHLCAPDRKHQRINIFTA